HCRMNPLGFGGRRQPSMGGTSRISREAYVRFCERLGVKIPGPTPRRGRKLLEVPGYTFHVLVTTLDRDPVATWRFLQQPRRERKPHQRTERGLRCRRLLPAILRW